MAGSLMISGLLLSGLLAASCSSAPEVPPVSVQVQYRTSHVYTKNVAQPKKSATARGFIFTPSLLATETTVSVNNQELEFTGKGTYELSDARVVEQPFVLEWMLRGYVDSTVIIQDTIEAPLLLKDFICGDTVSRRSGLAIIYNSSAVNENDSGKVYAILIEVDNEMIRVEGGDKTMFDQPDNGHVELTPTVLSELDTGSWYRLSFERGRSRHYVQHNVDLISNSFSEVTTYFYLVD